MSITGETNGQILGPSLYNPHNFSQRIFERDYVEGVLGIRLPLNESSPYSHHYHQQIINEQLQLEGFFKDFRKLKGQMKDAALALRYVFEDPARIKQFVDEIIGEVNKVYDKFMKWSEKLLKAMRKMTESFASKAMKTVGTFIKKLQDSIKSIWESTDKMDGWKKALFAIFASVSIRYIWDQITDAIGDDQANDEKIDAIMAALGDDTNKIEESFYYAAPSLVTALYETDDERLDEFMKSLKKFGSKVKDKAKKANKKLSKTVGKKNAKSIKKDVKSGAKDAAKDAADDLLGGSEGDGGGEVSDEAKEGINEFLKPLIVLVKKIGKGFLKNMGIDLIASALTGGVGTAFKYMARTFKGVKYVFKVIGKPLEKFVGKIKDQKAEETEAIEGKDDPTDPKTQKESYLRRSGNHKVKITKRQLRQIIKESINEVDAGTPAIGGPSSKGVDHLSAVDTFEKIEALKSGDKITINGKPAQFVNVDEFNAILTYVDDGKSTLKDLDYRLAVIYDDDPEDMLPELAIEYVSKGQLPQKLRQPAKKKGPGKSYSVMD